MIKALVDLLEQNKKDGMSFVEIGAWVGETTKHCIPIIKENNGSYVVIDWFSGNEDIDIPEHIHTFQPHNKYRNYRNFLNNVGGLTNIESIMTVIAGDSKEVSHFLKDESKDIIFIDGCHLYQNVKKDIELYLPKVKPGGILCGHDCENINLANAFPPGVVDLHYWNGCHPGVIQAVYDAFGYNVQVIPDPHGDGVPIWVYKKEEKNEN